LFWNDQSNHKEREEGIGLTKRRDPLSVFLFLVIFVVD
jgi:hypothetical protein